MSAEQDLANANVQIASLISEVTRFRDAAMGINNLWPTITEGRNNTADGKYFSVPGGGAYLKLYRRAGTSQTLIAEFPDRAQVQGLLDTLGGREVIGGSGELLAKSAFGIGAEGSVPIPGDDLNSTSIPTGIYLVSASTANRPVSMTGMLLQMNWTSGQCVQMIVQHSPGNDRGRVFTRAFQSGDWTPWRISYDSENLKFQAGVLDPTPGRVLVTASFGLGAGSGNSNTTDNPDSITVNGFYRVLSGAQGVPTQTSVGVLLHLQSTLPGNATQMFWRSASQNQQWLRNKEEGVWGPWVANYHAGNTTVDSNGFIKAASPIFRLANSAESATDESHGFTDAGSGAANGEAQGVTATYDAQGVYTVTGSLGFAKAGWTVEVPQDANGNRLCVVETEQADDGTITVRTFSKRIDPDTGDVVADQPMDIPEGRWIDLRLSMPEPPTNDHPDDAPEPPAPLTPEEQEQQRIEQLERWRASAAITPRQARLVLAKHGLLTSVTDAIAAIEDEQQRQIAEIEWEYATTIERAAPWVGVLYGSLGLSQEGVDELFREAALL